MANSCVNFMASAGDLLGLGFVVFPCQTNGKAPATGHGYKDATDNEWILGEWSNRNNGANVGIPTGEVNGITIVDLDIYKDGGTSVRSLEKQGFIFPPTVEARTGKGGRHLFYKYVKGLRNSASRLARNVDIRSDGGYVVAPGSYLSEVNDKTGEVIEGPYEWVNHPSGMDMAEFPAWALLKLMRDVKRPAARLSQQAISQIKRPDGNTHGLHQFAAGASNGERNTSLFWAGCQYYDQVAIGVTSRKTAVDELHHAAKSSGLDPVETPKTIASALSGKYSGNSDRK